MKRHVASILAFALFAVCIVANSGAQEKKEEKKKEGFELPPIKRGDEFKVLTGLVGNFDAKVKFYPEADKPAIETTGTLSRKMVLGGNFLQENFKGKFFDKTFLGMGMLGWDSTKKQYTMTWYDSMSTTMSSMLGTYDADKKTLTFLGDEIDPKSGKKMKARDVLKIVSGEEQIFEMYRQGDGAEFKVMDIAYKKTEKKKEEKKKDEKK